MCIRDRLCSQVLSLPIFPELSEDQQEVVIDTVRQLVAPNVPAQFRRANDGDQDRTVA